MKLITHCLDKFFPDRFVGLQQRLLIALVILMLLVSSVFLLMGRSKIDAVQQANSASFYDHQFQSFHHFVDLMALRLNAFMLQVELLYKNIEGLEQKKGSLFYVLDKNWPSLSKTFQVSGLAVFDVLSATEIKSYGEYVIRPDRQWLQAVVDSEFEKQRLLCEARCVLQLARPIYLDGKAEVILVTLDLNEALNFLRFFNDADIALLNPGVAGERWNNSSVAEDVSGFFEDKMAVLSAYSLPALLAGIEFELAGRQFYAVARQIDLSDQAKPYLLLVDDVSNMHELLNRVGYEILLFSLLASLLVLLVGLKAFSQYLQRIKAQIESLPLLADKSFAEFRSRLTRHESVYSSELDLLDRTALDLSYQLEHMHNAMLAQTMDLENMAMYDELTGLANRSRFRDELEKSISGLSRKQDLMALLFLDLDKFKRVNDSMGHSVGDELLIQVSRRLLSAVRETDMVGRLGGDEFTVLLRGLKSEEDVDHVIKNIVNKLSVPVDLGFAEWQIGTSIGVTFIDSESEQAENALKKADMAMYEAKEAGRGNYKVYTESMQQQLEAKVELELLIPSALENNEFFLEFQPQYQLSSRQLTGVEALIRWNHPELGLLSPVRFIPILEESGLIRQVGYWTIDQCCAAIRQFVENGMPEVRVAINLAVSQLIDPKLIPVLKECIERYKIRPQQIELEITESLLMENLHHAIDQLNALRELGFSLAIDDFGTGYSSLTYLKKLPVDLIKIDRAFIGDLLTSPADREIVLSVLRMGHSLGKKILAEGIETEAQETFLMANGFDLGQGYLYGKPILLEDVLSQYSRRQEMLA
jgi:diguanylate cyclase (GGDEF)-like protein